MLSAISHGTALSRVPIQSSVKRPQPKFQQPEPAILFGAESDKKPSKKWALIPAALAAALLGATHTSIPAKSAGSDMAAGDKIATCQDDGRRIAVTPIDPGNLNSKTITDAVSMHTANLAEYARPAVVKVETDRKEDGKVKGGHGSGFVCRADGLILTNWHVVEDVVKNNGNITVRFADGRHYKGTFVGADKKMDIAVVRIKPERPLPTLRLADSDKIRVGEYVAAFGNPFYFDWTFTSGTVTAKRREALPDFDSLKTEVLQTDTTVNPGNSGGPFLNRDGEVDGLATAIYSSPTNSFGNTANNIKRALWRIENNKTLDRLTLGIQHPPVSAREYFERFGPEMGSDNPAQREALLKSQEALSKAAESVDGLLVLDVAPDSNAAKMGWKTGDVIVSINGEPLGRKVAEHGINWHYADEAVSFGVFRNGEHITTQYQGTP